MQTDSLKCLKCEGLMEEGFVPDLTDAGIKQSFWVEGLPEKSWRFGLKLKGKRTFPIRVFRCCNCGHLDFYAQ